MTAGGAVDVVLPVERAIRRVARALPDPIDVALTVLLPAGGGAPEWSGGPIDAVVHAQPPGDLARVWPHASFSAHAATVPHTRCGVAMLTLRFAGERARPDVVAALDDAPDVLVTPAGLGLTDTAVVAELLRGEEGRTGERQEAVVLGDSLVVDGDRVAMWVLSRLGGPAVGWA